MSLDFEQETLLEVIVSRTFGDVMLALFIFALNTYQARKEKQVHQEDA